MRFSFPLLAVVLIVFLCHKASLVHAAILELPGSIPHLILHSSSFFIHFKLLLQSPWAWFAVMALHITSLGTSLVLTAVGYEPSVWSVGLESGLMLLLLYLNRFVYLGRLTPALVQLFPSLLEKGRGRLPDSRRNGETPGRERRP